MGGGCSATGADSAKIQEKQKRKDKKKRLVLAPQLNLLLRISGIREQDARYPLPDVIASQVCHWERLCQSRQDNK